LGEAEGEGAGEGEGVSGFILPIDIFFKKPHRVDLSPRVLDLFRVCGLAPSSVLTSSVLGSTFIGSILLGCGMAGGVAPGVYDEDLII